LQAV
jgi:hypothetical protein